MPGPLSLLWGGLTVLKSINEMLAQCLEHVLNKIVDVVVVVKEEEVWKWFYDCRF